MSKHWNPRVAQGGARRPRVRTRSRRSSGITVRDFWQTLALGLGLGLFYVHQTGDAPLPDLAEPSGAVRVADPWAVRITDGDTFRYGGEKIRIADIDTPEMNGRCVRESRLAAQAKARMEGLLQAGPFEMHGIGRDEDRYGRKLRIVTRGGQSLGDQLVAEGLARTWTGRREPWC